MKEATVILGGGAALGFAHIGVLKELEKNYKITRIIGTSMGSIVGGLYAYGMTPTEILEFGKEFKYLDFINPLNIDLKFQGLLDGSFIEKKINQKIKNANIEETKIKYSAVAFDISSKYTVVINSGNCAKAMRASSAIPYIFNPVSAGNYLLVDGGVEYPLPCLDIHDDEFTIGVNVLPVIANKIVHLNVSSDKDESKKKSSKKWYEIVMEAINCNQAFLVQDMLKKFTPDIYINCDITSFLPAEFLKIEEIAKLGEEIAKQSLNKV
jgi:NTE family protein